MYSFSSHLHSLLLLAMAIFMHDYLFRFVIYLFIRLLLVLSFFIFFIAVLFCDISCQFFCDFIAVLFCDISCQFFYDYFT